jgi:hypothetical protein
MPDGSLLSTTPTGYATDGELVVGDGVVVVGAGDVVVVVLAKVVVVVPLANVVVVVPLASVVVVVPLANVVVVVPLANVVVVVPLASVVVVVLDFGGGPRLIRVSSFAKFCDTPDPIVVEAICDPAVLTDNDEL